MSLAVLGGGGRWRHAREIAAGSLLPDLPMFLFFVWERFVQGTSQDVIWGHAYFLEGWQQFFDVFNSVPLALVGLLLARAARRPGAVLFFAGVLVHVLLDLPLHHDDAHGHFWPLSDWRFESPVSYWDPRHHGAFGAGLEVLAVGVGGAVLWRRSASRWGRGLLLGLAALELAAWLAVYAFGVRLG